MSIFVRQRKASLAEALSRPSEVYHQREISNQTATFAKIPKEQELFKFESMHLSSISEEPEPAQLESSMAMPQPLIKGKENSTKDEFLKSESPQQQSKPAEEIRQQNPNITFYPHFADRLLYQSTDLSSLIQQQSKLKGELGGLSEMITDLVNKKSEILNEYETIIRDKKCLQRLKRNLEQQYEGYLFMLEGDYCQRLDEETERQRQLLGKLKKEVHALNSELSKPIVKDVYKEDIQVERIEKEFYELQMIGEKQRSNNKRRLEHLTTLLAKNAEKEKQIKQITKTMDKMEYDRQYEDDVDLQELKISNQQYEELSKRLSKVKKIKETNLKVKEIEFYRKVKEGKEKDAANKNIDHQIQQMNEKLYKVLVELEKEKEVHSKVSTFKQLSKAKEPATHKRNTSESKEPTRFLSEKNKLTIQAENHTSNLNRQTSRSLAKINTQGAQNFDDRPQLLMRKRKIYTELQRNFYFKNIENSQHQKLSRIYEFDNKEKIAISSYDRFQTENMQKKELKLPEIAHRLKTEGNESIIYSYDSVPQRRLNKKSIDMHNKNIKQLRANKYYSNLNNYQQLCTMLNRDRLLIEEDCEYDMSQLIYNSRT